MVRMLPCKLNNSCPLFNLFDLDYNNLLCALELFLKKGKKKKKKEAQHNNKDFGSLSFPPQCSGAEPLLSDGAPGSSAVRGQLRGQRWEGICRERSVPRLCWGWDVLLPASALIPVWFVPFFPGSPR